MLRRCAVPPTLLFLALVSFGTPVSAQNPDVQALDVNLVNSGTAGASAFVREATSVTSRNVVDRHNHVRSEVHASDMDYVDQHGSLTGDIKAWLGQCSFLDDTLIVRWDHATYPHVNGFKAKMFSADSISSVISYISQMSTSSSYYKLLMKSDIRYLGCGSVRCPMLFDIEYTMVACLYASRSKLDLTEAPYKSGEPCTECSSGTFWCHDNLCRDDCYHSNAHCECQVDCGRYSTVSSNCSCLCPNGYEGNKCQEDTTTHVNEDGLSSEWTDSGTTLVISVTLVLLALLSVSLCLILYHKKYRLSKLRTEASLESRSSESRTTNIYSTPVSASTFDPSKYPSPPPAYSSISLTTGLDPPPYGITASPTDAAEEVGGEGSPPPYHQIDV